MVQRIVSGDPWWTGFSALLLLAGFPLALGLWARGRADSAHLQRRTIIALTVFSSAGSAGAFALGAGIAFLNMKKEKAPEAEATLVEEPKKKT